ncbi:biopolymer transporter ExbD [Dysgonomonas sp. 216]|uniref:ExbD/TolR family protein n=1 Tax=Dysgonomonas sp. 216 TaxID=2302934 RepID=UPI0013CF6881|nr:biopolymer transporter ExbD [Dysgonomonas sp. 216]NDW19161.1 biopolymer transporter ExbD [Dysgonomonas sp. 216]
MKIERRKTRSAEVYTSSLNDIMFFLLLFFLIISTMVTPAAIRVVLPKSATSENVLIKKSIIVYITADRQYAIDDQAVTFDEIEPLLAAKLASKAENEEFNVLLQADKTLTIQDVIDVIDIGNKLQVKMALFTEKDK